MTRGLSWSAFVIAAVVGAASSGCELKPDPNPHAASATTTPSPASPDRAAAADAAAAPDAAPAVDRAPSPDGAAPPDAGLAIDGGAAATLPDGGPPKPAPDLKLESRVLARCVAQKRHGGRPIFHTENTPFSVLIGSKNHWTWVNHSTASEGFRQQVEVPLDSLVRASGVAGLTPSVEVLVVSGDATDQDQLGETNDDKLNQLIYKRQHAEAVEIVRLTRDSPKPGTALVFGTVPGCVDQPSAFAAAARCPTPQCPK